MSELKPCPFCGGEAELDEYCGKYVVFCKNASCSWRKTKAEAIEAWNTRHERTCEFMPYSEKSDDGICSKCGAYMYEQDNYCPDCGARVKEDADADGKAPLPS